MQASAQKIEKYYDYQWREISPENARFLGIITKTDSGWHRQDYFIQERMLQMDGVYEDSDCKVPNGLFNYFYPDGRLQHSGHYVHGEKNGLWLSFHSNGMMNDSTSYNSGHKTGTSYGWYENGFPSDSAVWNNDGSGVEVAWFDNGNPSYAGKYSAGDGNKNGKWQFFHRNGRLSASELYKDGKLISKQYFDEQGNETDTINRDRPATFPGGIKAWQKYLEKKLYFPSQYKLVNADKAVVVIDATIDEEGNVINVDVSTPFHPAFDKIAVEVVSKSPQWQPAIQHNRKLRYRIRQAVFFAQD